MNINDILIRVSKRKKELKINNHMQNILILLLPSLIVALIFGLVAGLAIYARFFSIALLSLVVIILPLFYVVEKRLRASISYVGKKDFSIIDGYKTFFTNRQSGIFGILSGLTTSIMFVAIFYLAFFRFFSLFCTPFDGSLKAYETITSLESIDYDVLGSNLPQLIKPGIVISSTIFFIPIFYLIFYSMNSNLSDHYLATIVLPDIDLNLPASQSRSLSKVSFKRYINRYLFRLRLRLNWPIYLIFTALYVSSVFIFISLDYSSNINIFFSSVLIMIVPLLSLFYGLVINYDCLINEYILVDEISPLLHEVLPKAIKESVKGTFRNPGYIHGEESLVKGAFFVEDNYVFDASNNTSASNKEETYTAYDKDSTVEGGIFDFTGNKITKAKTEQKKAVKKKEIKKDNNKKEK